MTVPVLVLGVAQVAAAERLAGPIMLWPCGARIGLLSLPLGHGRGTRAALLRRVAMRIDPFLPLVLPHRDPAGLARRIATAPALTAHAMARCAGRVELGLAAEARLEFAPDDGAGSGRAWLAARARRAARRRRREAEIGDWLAAEARAAGAQTWRLNPVRAPDRAGTDLALLVRRKDAPGIRAGLGLQTPAPPDVAWRVTGPWPCLGFARDWVDAGLRNLLLPPETEHAA